MRFDKYIKEGKMGKLPSKIVRTAYLKDYPAMLKWELINPDSADDRANYKTIEKVSWKELMQMKTRNAVSFYDDAYDVNGVFGLGPNSGDRKYEATVKLNSFSEKELKNMLRKMKFKVK